ncbi:hypothetical protein DPMN_085070 [Dreissena polymorpha]|uniref:Uncharacterized protein n=1 Tax=Dreissena polymorpha TaxID=45954 RepID=A0A9D4BJW4_DREPO|nr:hypothetical protein DPMN_085070 [Dreissena polymorpha]
MRDLHFMPSSDIDAYGSDKFYILTENYSKPKVVPEVPGITCTDARDTKDEYSLLKPIVLQQ